MDNESRLHEKTREPRKDIIKMVVDWQISRHSKKTGYTKTRGEVAGSRKIQTLLGYT